MVIDYELDIGLNPCFDRIYFQSGDIGEVAQWEATVSILVLIEFIFNEIKK